jgi:SAM-dependent methyltransferase
MTAPLIPSIPVNPQDIEHRVKTMYRAVALYPKSVFHFEMGREMAERLGYAPSDLDAIPAGSVESFAGVGYHFGFVDLCEGHRVVDFGSGSGMDSFIAATKVGHSGDVVGIDMTDEQLYKAMRLRDEAAFCNVSYKSAYIEDTGLPEYGFDVVISNGVINLAADKLAVFREAHRILRSGGRLAISDIVSGKRLPEKISCDASLWAACIGGAMEQGEYLSLIESAGLRIIEKRDNPQYRFISSGANWATRTYGVKSISLLAVKD